MRSTLEAITARDTIGAGGDEKLVGTERRGTAPHESRR
jgi:hypothetical protein